MPNVPQPDQRFGDIAVSMQMVPQEKFDRALVVQGCIFNRTKVHMSIGKVLKEMGLLTQEQVDEILKVQNQLNSDPSAPTQCAPPEKQVQGKVPLQGLHLTLTSDKLSAYLSPTEVVPQGVTLDAVKAFLAGSGVVHGLIEDQALAEYIAQTPLPAEPLKVAEGLAPIPGRPPEVIYHFDIDPLRIGTMKSDGTMDWKNRGEIPQVNAGDVLVEKTEGDPGRPGMSVCGKEMLPPRIREPQLKCAKGAQRSEDGLQIVAKIPGTPKISSDGKISVFGMLPIKGDVGVETGHIDFSGHIEISGGVTAGYSVKGKGLRTTEIQDTDIEISEDVICYGGIYGSTLKVGGNIKTSHIHNCRVELLGDLIVEKEIIGCTIVTNGRCVISEGKIIASKIDAKKGIEAQTIGTEAAKPCELIVGIDRPYDRDMAAFKEELVALQDQKKDSGPQLPLLAQQVEAITTQLGGLAQEQERFMAQKRQFEEQLQGQGPNAVADEEEQQMLQEMIVELDEKNAAFEHHAKELLAQEDKLRLQLIGRKKSFEALDEKMAACKEKICVLEQALKVDPGQPVVKVSGVLFAKTKIIGFHKEITIPQNMEGVRVAEIQVEGSAKYQMKISNLR
jgi:uncharacterized protein